MDTYRIDDSIPATGACSDERGHDPCEPSAQVTDYYGTERTPRDAADDREWIVCDCDQYTVRGLPDEECLDCLGYGVLIATEKDIVVRHCAHNANTTHCDTCLDSGSYAQETLARSHALCRQCSGGDDTADCAACYGTGYRFQSSADFDAYKQNQVYAQQRVTEAALYEYYEQVATQILGVPPAELPPAPEARFQLRVIQLESEERRACGHCNDGRAKINHTYVRCTTCNGAGHVALVTGQWLCEVDLHTSYYQHTSGKLASGPISRDADILPGWTLRFGTHYPKHLPIERRIPFHTNDAVRHAALRPHTVQGKPTSIPARSWRTSDGAEQPITRVLPDGSVEHYRNTYSLRSGLNR